MKYQEEISGGQNLLLGPLKGKMTNKERKLDIKDQNI